MTPTSQPGNKLMQILDDARERSARSRALREHFPQAAGASGQASGAAVEDLLDKNRDLPDPLALARLYRSPELVERLPDEDDARPGPSFQPPGSAGQAPAPETTVGGGGPDPGAMELMDRPRFSAEEVREVMAQLRQKFGSAEGYAVYQPAPPMDDALPGLLPEPEPVAPARSSEWLYLLGGLVALLVIGVFVYLAVVGPLSYHPPSSAPTFKPSSPTLKP